MKEVINATGRRKEAVARVFLFPGTGKVEVNDLSLDAYFPMESQRINIRKMYDLANTLKNYDVRTTVKGGGKSGQVDALRLGIARALVKIDPSLRKTLKIKISIINLDTFMLMLGRTGQPKT